jgi:hypothetical protein
VATAPQLHHIFLSFFGREAVDPHILHVRVNEAKALVACSVCSGSPIRG